MASASTAPVQRYMVVRVALRRMRSWGLVLGPIALVVALWEVAVQVAGIASLVPPPSGVLAAAAELQRAGQIAPHVLASTQRALLGFAVAAVLGITLGLVTGRLLLARVLTEPLIQLLRPIPAIAWVPFSILWFGVGETPKVFVIAIGAFFPIWLNTHLGAKGVDRTYIEVAQNAGVRGFEQFWRVVLPATLPHIISGLRIGFGLAFILLVAAELTGASTGMGALISRSHLVFRPDRMVVGMVLLGMTGALGDWVFTRVVRRFIYWEN